jgi:hypothetical protein
MKQYHKPKKDKDITIIGDEWNNLEHPEYACSYCSRLLIRLSNNGEKNESWFCRSCSIEFPYESQTRKKSKLGIQRKEVEPEITSIQIDQSKRVELRHEPELKDGALALSKKGTIRFTSYSDSSQK